MAEGGQDEAALAAAVALSQLATHPISECVVGLKGALPPGSRLPHVTEFQLRPGVLWSEHGTHLRLGLKF